MNRFISLFFVAWVFVAVSISFTQRSETPMQASELQIHNALMLDVVRMPQGRLVSVGERGLIFISDDQGQSWRQVTQRATEATLTAITQVGDRALLAVGHDAVIVRSEDGGESWQLVHAQPEDEQPLLSVVFDAHGHGVAAGAYGLLLRSDNWGVAWHADDSADNPDGLHINGAATDGAELWLAVGEAGLILRRSADETAWQALHSPYLGSLFGVLHLQDGSWLAYGMRGHVLRSDRSGLHWQSVETGSQASLFGGSQLSDGRIVLVGQAGEVLISVDGGQSFVQQDGPDRQVRAAVLEVPAGRPGQLLLVGEAGAVRFELPQSQTGVQSPGEAAS